jgi:SAM-dependent methyltransferase
MDSYNSSFNNRVSSYIYAMNKYGYNYVMDNEFENVLDELNNFSGNSLLNLASVGSSLINVIKKYNIDLFEIGIDANIDFAKIGNVLHYSLDSIPFEDSSFDKVISIANLHHSFIPERKLLFKEVFRVLRNNGVFLMCDVEKNSKEDFWLNHIVNKYNPNGHVGIFFDENDKYYFEDSGFNVTIKKKSYVWKFHSHDDTFDFLFHLFGLYSIPSQNTLISLLEKYLDYHYNPITSHFELSWSLLYFICIKK